MRTALVGLALLAAGCSGSSATGAAPSPQPSPSPTVNTAVLDDCQQIAAPLGDVSAAFESASSGEMTETAAYAKVQQSREQIDKLADGFASKEIAVNAHGVADRIGVMLVSMRNGEDPSTAVDTVGSATDDFLAACHRVAGG